MGEDMRVMGDVTGLLRVHIITCGGLKYRRMLGGSTCVDVKYSCNEWARSKILHNVCLQQASKEELITLPACMFTQAFAKSLPVGTNNTCAKCLVGSSAEPPALGDCCFTLSL